MIFTNSWRLNICWQWCLQIADHWIFVDNGLYHELVNDQVVYPLMTVLTIQHLFYCLFDQLPVGQANWSMDEVGQRQNTFARCYMIHIAWFVTCCACRQTCHQRVQISMAMYMQFRIQCIHLKQFNIDSQVWYCMCKISSPSIVLLSFCMSIVPVVHGSVISHSPDSGLNVEPPAQDFSNKYFASSHCTYMLQCSGWGSNLSAWLFLRQNKSSEMRRSMI